ncbi:type II secretion system protein [Gudongella sp. DL1XJH-153]|uniref:type II secretion system protein n=1 Tax=Gudongella sp. DL1XJH-153 TaxID=3409804 RepID=UPI003BB80A3E
MKDNKEVDNQFKKGFTLIELIVIISILGILLSLAMVSYGGIRDKAASTVCKYNLRVLNQEYEAYLEENELDNTMFSQETYYRSEYKLSDRIVCPIEGDISYLNGKFRCEIHIDTKKEDSEDDSGGEIPYL